MANIINGTAGADALNGLSGDNVISGGGGSDKLNGGAGLDTLDGGSGSDTVSGNSGDDVLIFRMSENVGSSDVYDGGSGKDVLQLNLTLAQWNSVAVQTDLAKYLTFLTVNTNVHTEEATNAIFQFTAFGLAASKIEFLQVNVDGAALTAEDNPVILAADGMGAGENTAGVGGNILGNDTVADQVATFTFTQAAHGAVSMITDLSVVNAPVATPTYTPTAGFWDYLAKDQTAADSFTYTVTDADGDTATSPVTVTITGTNDPVTITSGAPAGAVVEDAATLSATGTVAFSDVDLSDNHTASAAAAVGNTTTLGTFALGTVGEAANAATGSVGWTYTLNNAAAQYLAQGQTATETYVVTVSDGLTTTTQNVVVTITGTNDAPTITSPAQAGAVVEDAATLSATGTVAFSDVDLSDNHTATAAAAVGNTTTLGTFALGTVGEAANAAT
ncbi:MAG: hypothetical protein JWR43_1887, partial [Phenylobacterium sp.]|nr:hypothetical protein [Phenylobacterium sp.]